MKPTAPSSIVVRKRPCEQNLRLILLGVLSSILSRYKEDVWDVVLSSVNGFPPFTLTFCSAVLSQSITIEQYIASQGPINKAGIRANIGPYGSQSAGAGVGLVVASPSTFDPDYLYTWTRDSALVFKSLIDEYTHGENTSLALRSSIDNYVAAQTRLQQVSNPSGTVSTGGLDGPPLRAIALITYANWLLKDSNATYVNNSLLPVIKLDLDYTAKYWNQSGFDLWEEVSSRSFFTTAVQHRALREGSTFATKIGQSALAPILASIHTFDATAGCDANTFQPCSDKALANHKAYVDVFRSIYAINSGIASNAAVATGRYAEDVYYGGQPWYLTTAAAAQQLYYALTVWNSTGSLQVTDISLEFFRQFSSSVQTGTYNSSTSTYSTLTNYIRDYADGFLLVNAKYTPPNGSLSEQFNRNTGAQLSAKDLTWSYAATNEAFIARHGFVPATWGAAGLVVPAVCEDNAGATVKVTFNVVASTAWGENIYLTGSIDELKTWSPFDAIVLSSASYPTWSVTLDIPASRIFEYKYVRKSGTTVTWESDPNRSFSSPATGTWVINDSWNS
ncbi:glucoamylase [Cyathus striatus]|nr:glucoamylase [Cyathus striatus]